MEIEIKTNSEGWLHTFRACNFDHQPSWKRYGSGTAELKIDSHKDRPYLSFVLTEIAHGHSGIVGNKGSSRSTMMTLDENEGRQLYEWLKLRYEDQAAR